jgi:uncharacterized protein (DUF1697 family)
VVAFVALLRGVNVGKSKRVPMAELRALLSGLSYRDVATLLNSGNAVFRADKGPSARHAARIASAIVRQLAVDVPVIVKSAAEFDAIVEENPFAGDAADHSRLLVAFVQDSRSLGSLAAVGELAGPPDEFAIGRHAAYLHCGRGILESKAGEALLGRTGRMATARNWATTLKLQALLGERSG